MFEFYHGNAGVVSQVEMCLDAQDAFEDLWIFNEVKGCHYLKAQFHQQDGGVFKSKVQFTTSSLSKATQSANTLIDGRALLSLAKLVVKNGKKALAIEKDITKNGLPSGWNDESLDTWILDIMFDRLKGNRDANDEDDLRKVDRSVTSETIK